MTQPFGLQPDDVAEVMARFGVAEQQVRRDHAISHILAALSRDHRDELIFFGGTALSRTHLIEESLSEDIDLIATNRRDDLATVLTDDISAALVRTHGRITWSPGWPRNSDAEPAVAITPDGMPTLLSSAGWKTAAWMDRVAARDLYDLWALSNVGALNAESASLFAEHGPTNNPPRPWMFDHAPSTTEWLAQLAGQTRLTVTPDQAIAAVRTAWATAVNEDWP